MRFVGIPWELREDSVLIKLTDKVAAYDVAHVCRALSIPVKVESGACVRVPEKHVGEVRSYLRGEINPRLYRDKLPQDYYGWRGDIYWRQ